MLLAMCLVGPAQAEPQNSAEAEAKPLAAEVEDLKKALIQLNRDLFILEQDLLFPSSTQVAVYLSMDVGHFFNLDSVEVKVDGDTVTHYLYTQRQVDALYRGGVQRLFVGNVNQGEHTLTAVFTGIGPESRPYKRAVTVEFDKSAKPAALELSIVDSSARQQPEFIATVL
ncbi:hypothetical protein DXV75_04285 [Alteromonas aestuariivivens]|uniref:AraC family transcriptional regulator n=2 Tax=Alteromonas aestuariivivens TaxID=1938339 RepID=A0A3D8MCK6_9ALTE|nr:hypothetical protein DXV75_04285 [Alteromonas aestuariivivens]